MESDTSMQGWKFVIDVPPIVYHDHEIVWKPRPHVEIHHRNRIYTNLIKAQLEKEITGSFKCPVTIDLDLYMPTKRVAYPTSAAHLLMKSLVPTLIDDPRFIKQVTSRVHYNEDDDKYWHPRSEVTVYPSAFDESG